MSAEDCCCAQTGAEARTIVHAASASQTRIFSLPFLAGGCDALALWMHSWRARPTRSRNPDFTAWLTGPHHPPLSLLRNPLFIRRFQPLGRLQRKVTLPLQPQRAFDSA